MSQFVGMEVEAVRQLARTLQQKAEEINQISATLTQQLGSTQWVGPDATQFRSDWSSTYVTNLRNVSEALIQANQNCLSNAQQQESASSQ